MKTFVLLGTLLLFGSAAQARDDVAPIRAQVERIEGDRALKVRSHEVLGQSSEGGEVRAWYRGKSLVKIASTFYGESGQGSRTLWLRDGAPIFLLVKTQRYERPLPSAVKVKSSEEERFYFQGARVVAHRIGDKSRPLSAAQSQKTAREARGEVAQLRRMVER